MCQKSLFLYHACVAIGVGSWTLFRTLRGALTLAWRSNLRNLLQWYVEILSKINCLGSFDRVSNSTSRFNGLLAWGVDILDHWWLDRVLGALVWILKLRAATLLQELLLEMGLSSWELSLRLGTTWKLRKILTSDTLVTGINRVYW